MRANPELERVVAATLYEGYLLYPYRQSVKSQVRWNFGVLFPPQFQAEHFDSERSGMRTECILRCPDDCSLELELRFLQVVQRLSAETGDCLEAEDRVLRVEVPTLRQSDLRQEQTATLQVDGGISDRDQFSRRWRPLRMQVDFSAVRISPGILRLSVATENVTPCPPALPREAALSWAMVSSHHVLQATGATFASMTAPPQGLEQAVADCSNIGTWPVLVGDGDDTLLSAPIFLDDHPRVSTNSPGDLFDATEVDELLTLNILALGDGERQDVLRADPRAALLLRRTDALTQDEFMRMHGTMRPVTSGDDRG